jgi:hypothetical protein
VDDRDDAHLLVIRPVEDPVRSEDRLPKAAIAFRDDATELWELGQRIHG